jgi:hypothetical protein
VVLSDQRRPGKSDTDLLITEQKYAFVFYCSITVCGLTFNLKVWDWAIIIMSYRPVGLVVISCSSYYELETAAAAAAASCDDDGRALDSWPRQSEKLASKEIGHNSTI